MERTQSARLVAAISAIHTNWKPSKETVAMYHSLLEDMDSVLAGRAVKQLLGELEWPPKPSQIRDRYRDLRAAERRAKALPETSGAEVTEAERQENLARIREYARSIGIEVKAA